MLHSDSSQFSAHIYSYNDRNSCRVEKYNEDLLVRKKYFDIVEIVEK